jgi:hypothetical protein
VQLHSGKNVEHLQTVQEICHLQEEHILYSFTQVRIWSICRPYICHLQEEHIVQLHSGQNVEHLQTEHLSSAKGAHCAAALR